MSTRQDKRRQRILINDMMLYLFCLVMAVLGWAMANNSEWISQQAWGHNLTERQAAFGWWVFGAALLLAITRSLQSVINKK